MDNTPPGELGLASKERGILQQSDVEKVVDLVSGKEADNFKREWVEANILSIKNVVQQGRHNNLYYPASGADIIRPLYAYDVDRLISVENDKQRVGITEKQLEEMGVKTTVQVAPDGKSRDITFELEGKQRRVTEVYQDARLVGSKDFGLEQVDVLHIYAPTGADTPIREDEIYFQKKYGAEWHSKRWDQQALAEKNADPNAPKEDPETGNYKTVVEGIGNKLTPTNYQMVTEGGFFVLNEGRLQHYETIPSLYFIAGLEEREIIHRHPYTVLTSMVPSKAELETMDRTGYIYQKSKTVSPQVIEVFNDALMDQFWNGYSFMEFERGDFSYMGIKPEEGINVEDAVNNRYAKLQEKTEEFVKRFTEAGVRSDLVNQYKVELLDWYRNKVLTLQEQFAELLKAYGEMSEKYNAGEMNDEQAKEYMGIVIERNDRGRRTDFKNTKWLLATQLVLSSEEKSRQVYELASQFVSANFSF